MSFKNQVEVFNNLRNVNDLAYLIDTSTFLLQLHSKNPKYKIFKIPKTNGDFRIIENPKNELKKIQRNLNYYFQKHYYYLRPESVYGFCIAPRDVELTIVGNAEQHVGANFMYNVDLKNFFHSIKELMVYHILETHFKNMDQKLVQLLLGLLTFNGRLPMGAPSSPIISNYACLELDKSLLNFSKYADILYTRYADDLTFSSNAEIKKTDIDIIEDLINQNSFELNEKKISYYTPQDVKTVTGIIVGAEKLTLPKEYLKQLDEEMLRLDQTLTVEQRYQTGMSTKKIKLFENEIRGKLNFVENVMGKEKEVEALKIKWNAIINKSSLERFESANWLDVPY
jgi:RNA-directed DNA polymerase